MGFCEQLPDGRWRAFESEGSGGRRLRANAIRRTRTEARNAAKAKLERKLKESTLEPHTLTLSAYLQRWLAHERKQGRSAHSLSCDESLVRQIPKALMAQRLADVAPLAVQKWLDELELAPATVRKRYRRLHASLGKAVAWRLLTDNPLDAVTPPKLAHGEMSALDEAQTAALLSALQGTRYHAPALVAVTTGLRRGELLALQWSDIEDGTMRVARSLDEAPRVAIAVKEPKSGKGRTLSLMAATVVAFEAHRKQQIAERLAARQWHERGLIFPDRRGGYWRPTTFSTGWLRFGETDGIRFHDLRHSHATQLLRAGVPVNVVSKRLGHASAALTLSVYAHVLADADEAAVSRLETSLGALLAVNSGTEPDTS